MRNGPAESNARAQSASVVSRWLVMRGVSHVQFVRDRTIGRDAIRHDISQQYFRNIQASRTEQRITLVDQVEDRPNDQRDDERSLGNTIRKTASPNSIQSRHPRTPSHQPALPLPNNLP